MAYMDFFQKIVVWNEERNLLAPGFEHVRETSYILEELLESTGAYDSETARVKAKELAAELIGNTLVQPEVALDAWADIIVFASGAIAKMGYDPSKVMDEVYKEVNSRTGQLIDGKFVKDKDVIPYQADFSVCRR
jgi:hypothetical protein